MLMPVCDRVSLPLIKTTGVWQVNSSAPVMLLKLLVLGGGGGRGRLVFFIIVFYEFGMQLGLDKNDALDYCQINVKKTGTNFHDAIKKTFTIGFHSDISKSISFQTSSSSSVECPQSTGWLFWHWKLGLIIDTACFCILFSFNCHDMRSDSHLYEKVTNSAHILMNWGIILQHVGLLKIIPILFHLINIKGKEHYVDDFTGNRP